MAKREGETEAMKKSEVVTARLDPKLKYLAELAARKHRRPLSSYIEWAVEQSLTLVQLEDTGGCNVSVADADRKHRLWDLDEADRVVRLALTYPELLTYDEQRFWKLVSENKDLWRRPDTDPSGVYFYNYKTANSSGEDDPIHWDRLRDFWTEFRAGRGSKAAARHHKLKKIGDDNSS